VDHSSSPRNVARRSKSREAVLTAVEPHGDAEGKTSALAHRARRYNMSEKDTSDSSTSIAPQGAAAPTEPDPTGTTPGVDAPVTPPSNLHGEVHFDERIVQKIYTVVQLPVISQVLDPANPASSLGASLNLTEPSAGAASPVAGDQSATLTERQTIDQSSGEER
jgi:hypothetical protein